MRLTWQRVSPAPALSGAFVAGFAIVAGTFSDLDSRSTLVWCLAALCLASLIFTLRRPGLLRSVAAWPLLTLVFALLGSALGQDRTEAFRQVRALPDENLVEIEGRLTSLWGHSAGAYRVKVAVERASGSGLAVPQLSEIVLRTGALTPAPLIANVGDRVRARGRLWVPELESIGPLGGLGPPPTPSLSVKSARQIEVLGGPSGLRGLSERLHRSIYTRIRETTALAGEGPSPAVTFFLALSIGETAELPLDTVALFREGGVAHVLAISGLQVGLIAGLVHSLLRALGLGYRIRDAVVLVFCLAYGALAGGSAPVFRTVLTLGWYFSARLIGRPVSPWQAVGSSALVLMLLDPANVFDVSFHLTFFAFAGLSGLYEPIRGLFARVAGWLPSGIRSLLAATLSAELAVFPVQAAVFGIVPVLGLVTNLVVVPLSSVFLVAGLVLAPALSLGGDLGAAGLYLLDVQFYVLERFLAAFEPFRPSRLIAAPGLAEIVALAVFVIAASLLRSRIGRALSLGAAASLALFMMVRDRGPTRPGVAEFWSLDVGQGDAWLLRGEGNTVLIDGGGGVESSAERSRERVLSLLRHAGITRLDSVVLTHGHPDHARGVSAVLAFCKVGRLVLATGAPGTTFLDEVLDLSARNGVPVHRYRAGDAFVEGSWRLEVLHPDGERIPRSRENNSSLVLRASAGGRSVLFTGDIEALAERRLLASGRDLRADILKVPHHGSLTSSTVELIETVAPRLVVVGVGKRNRFGHPAPAVIERFQTRSIRVFRTDLHGTVRWEIREGRLFPVFSPWSRR